MGRGRVYLRGEKELIPPCNPVLMGKSTVEADFLIIDKGRIIEELSENELNEKCRQHIAIKTPSSEKAILVLQQKLSTDNFKVMPDGTIQLYDFLDDMEKVAGALAEEKILVTGLSITGDSLEDYFLAKIGGAAK